MTLYNVNYERSIDDETTEDFAPVPADSPEAAEEKFMDNLVTPEQYNVTSVRRAA